MASFTDIMTALQPQKKLDLSATPAQQTFNPDEQMIRQLLLGKGAELAQDQTASFLGGTPVGPQAEMFNGMAIDPATGMTIPTNPRTEESFNTPQRMAPQTEASLINRILGTPGTEPLIERRAPQFGGMNSDVGNYLTAALGALAGEGTPAELIERERAADMTSFENQQTADAQQGTIDPNVFAPQKPPTNIAQTQTPEPIVTEPIATELQTELADTASPENIAALLDPETEPAPEVVEEVKQSFFNQPEMGDLMLGLGIGLMQGKDLGSALLMGVQMKERGLSSKAAAARQGIKDDLEAKKMKAETSKLRAEATKLARRAGSSNEAIKQFTSIYKTNIGEAGIGDEVSSQRAQALTATQVLANSPDDKGMQKLRDDAIGGMLSFIASLDDAEEQQEEITKLKAQFGDAFIQEKIDNF